MGAQEVPLGSNACDVLHDAFAVRCLTSNKSPALDAGGAWSLRGFPYPLYRGPSLTQQSLDFFLWRSNALIEADGAVKGLTSLMQNGG